MNTSYLLCDAEIIIITVFLIAKPKIARHMCTKWSTVLRFPSSILDGASDFRDLWWCQRI